MNSEIGYEFTMKHPWFSVPVLLCEIKIPPTFKCVYLHILRRAGGVADFNMTTRRCFETQTSLAQNAGVDRKTVREAYRWLVAHKMIRVLESERNKPTIVEVTSTHEWIIPKGSRVLESNEEGHKKETKTIARGELGRFTKKEPQEQKGVGESAPPTNHRAEENTSPCEKDVIDNIEQQITVLGNPLTVETTVLGNPHPTTVIKNDAESTVSWGNDRSRLGEITAAKNKR